MSNNTLQLNQKLSTEEKAVFFLHIPKAAGTTLRYIIQYQANPLSVYELYGKSSTHFARLEKLRELPESRREKIKFVNAHLGFGFHNFLLCPYTYITILRDPVDRVISMYYYLCRTRPKYSQEISLEDFVRTQSSYTKNDMTKYLSGIKLQIQIQSSKLNQSENEIDKFYSIDSDTLEVAKKNLKQEFTVVGLLEYFDETLILLKRMLGWKIPVFTKNNVTHNRILKSEIPKKTMALIEEYNQFDIQLYEYAKKCFRELIEQQDSSFVQEVEQFKNMKQSNLLQFYYRFKTGFNRLNYRIYKELLY